MDRYWLVKRWVMLESGCQYFVVLSWEFCSICHYESCLQLLFCWQFSQLLLLLVVDQISNGWNNVWRGFNHGRVTTKGFQGVYTCVNSLMLCKGMLLFYWCSLNKFTIITMLFSEMNSVTVYVEYVIYPSRITRKLCREKSTMLLEFINFITLFFEPKFSKPIL